MAARQGCRWHGDAVTVLRRLLDYLYVDAVLHGGPGLDRAWLDDDDPRTSIEQRLEP